MCGKNSKSKVHTPMKASDYKWITLITITRIYFLGLRLQTGGPAQQQIHPASDLSESQGRKFVCMGALCRGRLSYGEKGW